MIEIHRQPEGRERAGDAGRRTRAIIAVAIFIALVVAGNVASWLLSEALQFELRPSNEHIVHRLILASIVAYCVLMAFPFVPGAEIGLALMIILGPEIAGLVYGCTVVSLTLSFVIGRMIPDRMLIGLLRDLGLRRASKLMAEFVAMDRRGKLESLLRRAPSRSLPLLLNHRYLAVAVAFHVPGNVVIGGGGGIVMVAGMSRLFGFPAYLLTVALAVSPVPIAVGFFGVTVQ